MKCSCPGFTKISSQCCPPDTNPTPSHQSTYQHAAQSLSRYSLREVSSRILLRISQFLRRRKYVAMCGIVYEEYRTDTKYRKISHCSHHSLPSMSQLKPVSLHMLTRYFFKTHLLLSLSLYVSERLFYFQVGWRNFFKHFLSLPCMLQHFQSTVLDVFLLEILWELHKFEGSSLSHFCFLPLPTVSVSKCLPRSFKIYTKFFVPVAASG